MAQRFTSVSQQRVGSSSSTSNVIITVIIIAVVILSIGGFFWLIGRGSEEDTDEGSSSEPTTSQQVEDEEADAKQGNEDAEEGNDQEDDEETTAAPTNDNFSQDEQSVGEEGVEEVTISSLEYAGAEGYYRLTFKVEGEEIPYTTAELSTSSNAVLLNMHGIVEDNSGISPGNGVDITDSVISTIFHEVTSEQQVAKYVIGVKKATYFYLHTSEDPKKIYLDVQEQEIDNGNGEEFTFSTDAQVIEGDAEGDVIKISGISYSNQGDVFRLMWRLDSVGTGHIPHAEAEIVSYEGSNAIKLVISNLVSDFAGGGNYDEAYNDKAVQGMKGSFSSHVSTYYIKLTSQTEYQLYYRTAPAQLIIDVKR